MIDSMLTGSCHCGRVRITLPDKPDQVTRCNCSICSKTGFEGVYYRSAGVTIQGDFDDYVRADSNPAYIALHRCRHCGIATHWTPLNEPPHDRIGINARLFEPEALEGVPVRQVDGRSRPA
ncbi:MAG: GFA family protein [Sphingomicrobium sp.]